MTNAAIHFTDHTFGIKTACGRDVQRVACWDDREAITCTRCRNRIEKAERDAELLAVSKAFLEKLELQAGEETQELPDETATTVDAEWQRTRQLADTAEGQRRHATELLAGAKGRPTMQQLLQLAEARDAIDAAIGTLVATARADGESWQKIAHKIGGTKQGAQQRYGRKASSSSPDPQQPELEL